MKNKIKNSFSNKYRLFKVLVILFLLLFSYHISASETYLEVSGNVDKKFDSLKTKLANERIDTSEIKLLNEISWHLALTDPDKSIQFADSAISFAEKINWLKGKAKALNIKAEIFRNKGLFEKALTEHKFALNIFKNLEDSFGIAETESAIGITYFSKSDYSNAFNKFDSALELYAKLDNDDGILNVNSYLGILFSSFGQHDKSIEYFERSLNSAKKLKNDSKIATQLNNLGIAHFDLGKYNKAIEYYQQAAELFKSIGDEFNYSLVIGNIGIPFTELKKYPMAQKYFEESLEVAVKIGDRIGIAHQYGNLGEMYFKMSKEFNDHSLEKSGENYNSEAIKFLKKSIAEFERLNSLDEQNNFLIILSDVYSMSGDYQNSLKVYKEAIVLKDSIQSVENRKIIADLEIKQELNNKEMEIALLNKEKEYESITKTAITILAVLILLIAGLISFFYKKKRDDNILLSKNIQLREKVEKELRINEKELTKHKNHLEKLVKDRTHKLENEIIEHKQTEEALLMAIERAEIANNAKSVFLANMSHELRTPLVGILGYSELLKSIIEDEDAKEMAAGINRTGNRLLNTLSLVLDLARIESDKFEINISEVDIISELKETYKNFKAMAENKNLKIRLDLHSESFVLTTDLGMFKVILENLINNAIKFTKEGEIGISTNICYENENPYLCLQIKDTGIGIQKKDIPRIFEEFKQLSEGFTKDFQGSGLGLSITKKFIDLLDGHINVESDVGKGTTFSIKFPVEIKAVA